MIPGKVAKCSGLFPVGFDDDQTSLLVAVSAPVNFNSQEAIRRMVRKGVIPYIGDQSVIHQLLSQWYEPEDLDLSNVPTFSSLEDLIELSQETVTTAINQKAQDIQAELVQDFFWVRLDFPSESHHYFYRYEDATDQNRQHALEGNMAVGYAAAR